MKRFNAVTACALLSSAALFLPTAGADMVGKLEWGHILFRGFNLMEVSWFGSIPIRCAFLTILVFALCKIPVQVKMLTAGLLSVLACVGWIGGTIAARDFLLNMESLDPIAVRYGVGLPLGLAANAAIFVIALRYASSFKFSGKTKEVQR